MAVCVLANDMTKSSGCGYSLPQIVELYDKLKDSMQKGDWKTFGENFSKLEEEINKLR